MTSQGAITHNGNEVMGNIWTQTVCAEKLSSLRSSEDESFAVRTSSRTKNGEHSQLKPPAPPTTKKLAYEKSKHCNLAVHKAVKN